MCENGDEKLFVIPLGGLGEIGKNMLALECRDEIIVIDCGLMFPEEDMLGIDLVIPDCTYLVNNKEKVKAFILTHGHEDHLGAFSYILPQLDVGIPIYGTELSLALLKDRLKEFGLDSQVKLNSVKTDTVLSIGPFQVEFFAVCHSISDGVGLVIRTPVGVIVHTGDFKFDQTPINGRSTDYNKLARVGEEGVLLLLSDSTNAEKPGFCPSEKSISHTFDEIFQKAKGRIIVTTFASSLPRIQQVINFTIKYGRQIALVGRSLFHNVNIASDLGYLELPAGLSLRLEEIDQISPDKLVLHTTGSQGEPMSALSLIAAGSHKWISVQKGDIFVISATPVPGNEELIIRNINYLFEKGANVIYELGHKLSSSLDNYGPVHVSGHGYQEELKLMLNLVKPRYFIPIHGEYRHLIHHAHLAQEVGLNGERVIIPKNGYVIEFTEASAKIVNRMSNVDILVDGLGVGDIGREVLKERHQLANNGVVVVGALINRRTGQLIEGPYISTKGFVFAKDVEDIFQEEAKDKICQAIIRTKNNDESLDEVKLKTNLRQSLGRYLYEKTKRKPVIIPAIIEV